MIINFQINVVHNYREAIVLRFKGRQIRFQKIMIKMLKELINLAILVISKNSKKMICKFGHQKNYLRRNLDLKKNTATHLKILFPQDKFCNNKLKK